MSLLEMANLIYIAYPIEMTGKKILKAKPKVYLSDSAIRNAVLGHGEDVVHDPDQRGMIVESAVFKHIKTFYYNMNPKLGYFRDSATQKEIDIVLSIPRGKIMIEVKYRHDAALKESEAIVEWSRKDQLNLAILVTKNSEDYGVMRNASVMKIPAFVFLYLLGHAEKHRYRAQQ